MKIKLISIFLPILLITGCASPDYNYQAAYINVSEPPLEVVNTAYIGDVMVRQGRHSEHQAIYLPNLVAVSWAYDLLPGYYLKKGEDENTETYLPSPEADGGGVDKAALADPWKAIMAYKDDKDLCIVTVFNAFACKRGANFERVNKEVMTSNSFQQTLIYNGKIGDKINIGYREFSNNLARPAFNNSVEYDMKTSNIIGYKGARIEIIEATNELIKYRVLENFNKAAI
jgi:hypothetical protein